MMKKRILGRTDIGVSELCLGTLNFGWKTNRETSFAILDHFRSEGGNFIQCNGVLPQLPDAATWIALSEIYVGEWLTRRAVPRREIFLATRASVHPPRGMSGAEQLRQSCENSLQRLGVDHVDLLVCHSHSPSVPLDELLLEMTKLVQSGKVRYFAMERCPLWRVMESIDRARRKNFCRLEALQADYSLLERNAAESELMELCQEHRLGLIVRSPLAGGQLTGGADTADDLYEPGSGRSRLWHNHSRGRSVRAELETLAFELNSTPASVALAWVLRHPVIASTTVGVHSVAQLSEAIRGSELRLSAAQIQRLDRASSPTLGRRRKHRGLAGPVRRPVLQSV